MCVCVCACVCVCVSICANILTSCQDDMKMVSTLCQHCVNTPHCVKIEIDFRSEYFCSNCQHVVPCQHCHNCKYWSSSTSFMSTFDIFISLKSLFFIKGSFNLFLLSQTTLLLEEKLFARSVSHVHQSRHYYCVQVHHNDKKWCTNVNVIVIITGHCWSVSLSCWK